jgi:hypothetical protein
MTIRTIWKTQEVSPTLVSNGENSREMQPIDVQQIFGEMRDQESDVMQLDSQPVDINSRKVPEPVRAVAEVEMDDPGGSPTILLSEPATKPDACFKTVSSAPMPEVPVFEQPESSTSMPHYRDGHRLTYKIQYKSTPKHLWTNGTRISIRSPHSHSLNTLSRSPKMSSPTVRRCFHLKGDPRDNLVRPRRPTKTRCRKVRRTRKNPPRRRASVVMQPRTSQWWGVRAANAGSICLVPGDSTRRVSV